LTLVLSNFYHLMLMPYPIIHYLYQPLQYLENDRARQSLTVKKTLKTDETKFQLNHDYEIVANGVF
jgi:hypothetical protein